MKISGAQIREVAKVFEAQVRVRTPGPQGIGTGGRHDRVDFSSEAQIMQAVQRAAKDTPATRDERIGLLKARIARGEYSVPAEDIADQMIKRLIADGLR